MSHYNKNVKITEQRNATESCKRKTLAQIQSKHIRITSDLSAQTVQARKAWEDVFQALKKITASYESYIQKSYHLISVEK
jgi:hypothetical protein